MREQRKKMDFRPLSFWSFNGDMEDEEIRIQIHQLKEQGYGGFYMHARAGMTLEYLGEDWIHACRVAVEEAKRENMQAWLYDENGWPSGFAGGLVPALGDDYTAKHLYFMERVPGAGDGEVLASYKRLEDGDYVRVQGEAEAKADLYCCLGRLKGYADLLNPKAIDAFIHFTHEKYKEELGEYFGNVIPGIFTDEPQLVGKFPYTFAYPKKFWEAYGYDFFDCAWMLCRNGLQYAPFKYQASRLVAEIFRSSFTEKLNAWCNANHLIFTGHFSNEDGLCEQTNANYNLMAQYSHMERPGIDFLGRRLTSPVLVKQVSDGAYLTGKQMITSESFGCSGWDVTFNDLAWIVDWQAAFGINSIVTHLSAYSMKGRRKRDYPAFFSYQEPWWEVFHVISDHIEKTNRFLSEGRRDIQMLVLYPITSMWCLLAGTKRHSDESRHISNQFRLLIENLLDLQKDFLIVTEEEFGKFQVEDGKAFREDIACATVFVPDSISLDGATYRRLKALSETGGNVVFVNRRPVLCEGNFSNVADKIPGEVVDNRRGLLEKYFLVTGQTEEVSVIDGFSGQAASGIICSRRALEDEQRVFVMNPSRSDRKEVWLKVRGNREIEGIESIFDGEYSYAEFTLTPTESRCFVIKNTPPLKKEYVNKVCHCMEIPVSNVELQDENALTVDKCDVFLNGELLCRDVLPAACADMVYQNAYQKAEKTRVQLVYRFRADFQSNIPENLTLVVESDGLAAVSINGMDVLDQKAGWWVDKSFHTFPIGRYVQNGVNEVSLEFVIYRPQGEEEQGEFEGYRNRFFYDIEPENIYIRGDFDVTAMGQIGETVEDIRVNGGFVLTDATEKISGELTHQGLWFYRGNISYKAFFEKTSHQQVLKLCGMQGTAAEIFVNGKSAGVIYRAPYCLPVSDYAKEGINTLEIILYGSNRNLLGPHHHVSGNPHFVGVPTFVGKKGFTDFIYSHITEEDTYMEQYSFVKLSCGRIFL